MSRRDLQEAIQDLVNRGQAKTSEFQPHGPREGVEGNRGKGYPARSSAGIASPLKEEVAEDGSLTREYHEATWLSADGLLSWPALKKLTMTDANGREVVFEYAEPPEDGQPDD